MYQRMIDSPLGIGGRGGKIDWLRKEINKQELDKMRDWSLRIVLQCLWNVELLHVSYTTDRLRHLIRYFTPMMYQRGWTSPFKAVQRLVQVELTLITLVHNKILPVELLRHLKTFLK